MKKLLSAVLILASGTSFGTVRTVCSSGCNYTSIQAAVNAASSGDTIKVNVNGTHYENGITINTSLVVMGNGLNATTVDGSDLSRIFLIGNSAAASVSFLDMTIKDGKATVAQGSGGGLCVNSSAATTLLLRNVWFYSNEVTGAATPGGAIYTQLGTGTTSLTIQNCKFQSNRANATSQGQSAGAIYFGTNTTGTVSNTVFDDNIAEGFGGAVSFSSAVTMSFINCSFTNNVAGASGGASNSGSASPSFYGCTFSGNSATSAGGALRGNGFDITNCTFYGNSAPTGGAVSRGTGATGNAFKMINCTLTGNSASATGGGMHSAATSAAQHYLINNMISGNTSAGGTADLHFVTTSLLTTNTTNYVGASNFSSGTFMTGTPGLSGSLASNGGPTQTVALTASSTLANAGTATVSGFTIPQKDQRNYAYTGGTPIGAYEYNGTDAMTISYSAVPSTRAAVNPVVSATITDPVGLPASGLVPRVYYRKGTTGTWYSAAGTLASGSVTNGVWSLSINHSQLGSLPTGTTVYYYVVAQDASTGAVVKSSPSGVVASDVSSIVTAPATLSSYIIAPPLPVTLLQFTGESHQGNNLLSWKTGSEIGTARFEVERSANGSDFEQLGTVSANGSASAYSFTDKNAPAHAYYRLRMVEHNGTEAYSSTVMLRRPTSLFGVVATPNPVNGILSVVVMAAGREAQVILINMAGITVVRQVVTGATVELPMHTYPAGLYFLHYQDADGHSENLKIQKQ
jgi:hypothetical protein